MGKDAQFPTFMVLKRLTHACVDCHGIGDVLRWMGDPVGSRKAVREVEGRGVGRPHPVGVCILDSNPTADL